MLVLCQALGKALWFECILDPILKEFTFELLL